MKNIWITLAWKEFWLPFIHWKRESCPGGRDFLWLTVFLALLLTLCLMMAASSEGVLNRFVDVLLGKKAQHGVPIWVMPNMLSENGRLYQIDSRVLNEIDGKEFNAAPYREIEALDTYVEFPGERVWGSVVSDENQNTGITAGGNEELRGWAVYQDDPLWISKPGENNFPLKIILNRSLFSRNFNYQAYLKGVSQYLPQNELAALPRKLNPDQLQSIEKLWLRLNIGGKREVIRFDVEWIDNIYTVDKIAFLFPLTTYHALQTAYRYPGLNYFPEAHGEGGLRIKMLLVEEGASLQAINRFVSAIGGVKQSYRGEVLVELTGLMSAPVLHSFAAEYGINFQTLESIAGDRISHGLTSIAIPCLSLPDDEIPQSDFEACRSHPRHLIDLDITRKGNGFKRSIVYVPKRTQLFEAIELLTTVRSEALLIHPVYLDALNKFAFLTRMIETMRNPFATVLLVSLIALVGIQLFTLCGHRRHRYGMFLSKGFEWWQIYLMMLFQVCLALILGVVAAMAVVQAVRIYLEGVLYALAYEYRETLQVVDLDLLPLSLNDYFSVAATVLLLTSFLAVSVLYFLPLRERTHPAVLFQQ